MEELTYKDFIDSIIKTRGRFACGEEYHERHHVVPKCMGGTDEKNNLIDLFAGEHFVAHKLLALENPDNGKLVHAWWMMCAINNNQQRYEPTPEEYEEARKAHSIAMSGENNPLWGKTGTMNGKRHTEESKKKMSERQLGENNSFYGKHHSDETRRKMSETRSGKNHSGCRPIYCYELDEYFWGAKEAEQKYGISHGSIAQCCRGNRRSAGRHPVTGEKLHWVYADEMDNSSVA